MTTKLMKMEQISREIIEKTDSILKSPCDACDICFDHQRTLMRVNFQATTLVRGIVAYLEKIMEDRRQKRRRHKINVATSKNKFEY